MHDGAERPLPNHPGERHDSRLETSFVADAELHTRVNAGLHRAAGAGGREAERLLAEYVLAGTGAGRHVLLVKCVRGRQADGLNFRIAKRLEEVTSWCDPQSPNIGVALTDGLDDHLDRNVRVPSEAV